MSQQTPQYSGQQYNGQPSRNQASLIVMFVVLGLLLVGILVTGGVLLLRNNNDDGKPAVEKVATRPSTPEAVQFRPVVKAEPNGCGASTTTASADTACGSDGIRYTLGKAGLDGTHVTEVVAAQSPDKVAWVVNLTLDDEGSKAFAQLTAGLATKMPPENQLAIVVRGKVVTAPTVMSEITGGKVQISAKTRAEAEKTAADITG
ncbi:SecDF P1 head subdomain-containing protein [Kribbella ginsengisoli]|uniref:SecDF P1 head subdomain domain-containing protein n=1 Tax=Kribbella ginsengisoli TaxID=363865 RepID=A0ABP6Z108_9ACTN